MRFFTNSALLSRNYRVYLFGNLFSVFGIWVQRLAIGWQAWELSNSSLVVGVIAAAQLLPMLILTPLFGVMADRIKPRVGAIVINAMMLLIAGVLGLVTLLDWITVELLFVLALFQGIAGSAYSPIRLTLIPDLVPRQWFASAVAISSIAFNTARFVGPALAGFIVAGFGLGWAYVLNALSYFSVIFSLSLLEIDASARSTEKSRTGFRQQMLEGLGYVRQHPRIRAALLLTGIVALFGRSIIELLPVFTAIVFEGGPDTLALLMSATGAGAVGASVLFSLERVRTHVQFLLIAGALVAAFALFVLSQATVLSSGLVGAAIAGFAISLVSMASQADIQLRVENHLRGRVLSLWTLLSLGGPAIGSIVAGAMARHWSPAFTAFVFAIGCASLVAVIMIQRHRWLRQRLQKSE